MVKRKPMAPNSGYTDQTSSGALPYPTTPVSGGYLPFQRDTNDERAAATENPFGEDMDPKWGSEDHGGRDVERHPTVLRVGERRRSAERAREPDLIPASLRVKSPTQSARSSFESQGSDGQGRLSSQTNRRESPERPAIPQRSHLRAKPSTSSPYRSHEENSAAAWGDAPPQIPNSISVTPPPPSNEQHHSR